MVKQITSLTWNALEEATSTCCNRTLPRSCCSSRD